MISTETFWEAINKYMGGIDGDIMNIEVKKDDKKIKRVIIDVYDPDTNTERRITIDDRGYDARRLSLRSISVE